MTQGITTRPVVALAIAAGLLCCGATEAKGPKNPGGGGGGGDAPYTIVPFAPDGVTFGESGAFGLSDTGDVVGVVETPDGQESYHLDLNTDAYTWLPGRVRAVNNAGEIVGTVPVDEDATDGYYLSGPGADPVLLSPLSGDSWAYPYSINDSQVIVGRSTSETDGSTAVVWRPIVNEDGTVTIDGPVPLFPLAGYPYSTARDINDPIAGGPFEVVGVSSDGTPHAVIWMIDLKPDGTLTAPSDAISLGTLDGIPLNGSAINASGDVCGNSGGLPILKPFDGTVQQLNVVRDTNLAAAWGINDSATCVGWIETVTKRSSSYRQSAYLWEGANADPVELEKLLGKDSGWDELSYADQINNGGVIGGSGYYNGVATGFIMIPSP